MAQRLPEINVRQRSIIRALLGANKKVTLRELAEETGLSSRSVRYNMEIVRSWLLCHDLQFINRPGYGLEVVAAQDLKNNLLQQISSLNDCDIILTRQQRIRIILLYLLTSSEPVAAKHVSEIEAFSRSTFFKDICEIESWLEKYQIRLLRRSSKGLRIEGSETSRRFALSRLLRRELGEKRWFMLSKNLDEDHNLLSESISSVFAAFLDQLEMQFARKLIRYIEENIGVSLSPISQSEIMVYLAIAIHAVKHDKPVHGNIDEQIRVSEEFGIAQMIAYQIQKKLDFQLNEKEKEIAKNPNDLVKKAELEKLKRDREQIIRDMESTKKK